MNTEYIKILTDLYYRVSDRREKLHYTDTWNKDKLGEQMGMYLRRIQSLGGKLEVK